MKRSAGVRLVSVVLILYGVYLLCLSAACFSASFLLPAAKLAESAGPAGTADGAEPAGVIFGMGLALLIVSVASATAGIGLLRGKNWARVLCVCLCVLLFIGSLAGLKQRGNRFFISLAHVLATTAVAVFVVLPGTARALKQRAGNM